MIRATEEITTVHLPRLLAQAASCSGGDCPAVYDHVDGHPGMLVVQGEQGNPELLATLSRLGATETAVVVPEQLVRDALGRAAEPEPVSAEAFRERFTSFRYSAFRLERLQEYAKVGPDLGWASLVAANLKDGKSHQRVHVIAEPLTEAMATELTDRYAPNVAAGEQIGIVPVQDGQWPDWVPDADFWLFDLDLYEMTYHADGTFAGALRVTDPERVLAACRIRDAALFHATAWNDYIAARPQLAQRLSQRAA